MAIFFAELNRPLRELTRFTDADRTGPQDGDPGLAPVLARQPMGGRVQAHTLGIDGLRGPLLNDVDRFCNGEHADDQREERPPTYEVAHAERQPEGSGQRVETERGEEHAQQTGQQALEHVALRQDRDEREGEDAQREVLGRAVPSLRGFLPGFLSRGCSLLQRSVSLRDRF